MFLTKLASAKKGKSVGSENEHFSFVGSSSNKVRTSVISWTGIGNSMLKISTKRASVMSTAEKDCQAENIPQAINLDNISYPIVTKAGAVVTSSRRSKRRMSNILASQAFAVATAGSVSSSSNRFIGIQGTTGRTSVAGPNLRIHPRGASTGRITGGSLSLNPVSSLEEKDNFRARIASATNLIGQNQLNQSQQQYKASIMSMVSSIRVLNIAKHWITKYPNDFEADKELKTLMKKLLEDLLICPKLPNNEQRVASQLLMQLINAEFVEPAVDLQKLLTPVCVPSKGNFDTLSALDIAEQLTYLDFKIFRSIRSEELLSQNWMKTERQHKAQNVLLVCKRFNEVSRLVVSEIISRADLTERAACIEKWAAIANICRCLQNYNGVLQICAALVNSSVYRLRRTWNRVSKQAKQTVERLKNLVASDGRFKLMREALHRCDPPCIPYLGMYLTDLSFIEEGALNITEKNLVNFCKMRMIAHVIREVQQYHQTPYLINPKSEVIDYLLDPTRQLEEEQTYQVSLLIEPRTSIQTITPVTTEAVITTAIELRKSSTNILKSPNIDVVA